MIVLGDLKHHHKDWQTYSGKTDRPVNAVVISLSQMTLLRRLTFLLRSLAVTLTVLLFWSYIFLLILTFVQQWPSFHWEIWTMLY